MVDRKNVADILFGHLLNKLERKYGESGYCGTFEQYIEALMPEIIANLFQGFN